MGPPAGLPGRQGEPVLLPQPHLANRVRQVAERMGAEAVVIDPALPLGLIGPSLGLPYGVVLHGAEVTMPGGCRSASSSWAGRSSTHRW